MQRRLIKQGGGGYTIYLPKDWVEANKLEKGSELDVEVSDNHLILSTMPSKKKSETTIKLSNLTESSIRTLITNTYRAGYDRIEVLFKDEHQFKILQDVIKTRLIGFDAIKKQSGRCVVENITEPDYAQFANLLDKMLMNIEALFAVTKERFQSKKITDEMESYEEIEHRIQKYDNFCRRAITKQKKIGNKSEFFWTFLAHIIHGQRELYHLNKLLDKKNRVPAKAMHLLEEAEKIFNLIKKAYENKDTEPLGEIHEMEKELIYKKGYNLLKDSKGEENLVVYHLIVCIRQLYLANSPLLGLII
jgi:antitoxin component of MazEF toxin-antitoxin module